MTVEHAALTGASLHEPKGVAAAAANTVYVADGVGSGTWQKITASQLSGTGNAWVNVIIVADVKATTVAGGSSISGTQTRTLNTTVLNNISGASLAANQVTLPAGTYMVVGDAPAAGCNGHMASIYDVTAATSLVSGSSEYSAAASGVVTRSKIISTFTLAGAHLIELRHYTAAVFATNGLGYPSGSGLDELYSAVAFWKIS